MSRTVIAAVALFLAAGPALADPGGNPHHRGGPDADPAPQGVMVGAVISGAEQALIRGYFKASQGQAVDVESLPPGIRRQLARGRPLPPGIARKALPGDLRSRLPARPGYDYQLVGTDVVLMELATGLIADVVHEVLR